MSHTEEIHDNADQCTYQPLRITGCICQKCHTHTEEKGNCKEQYQMQISLQYKHSSFPATELIRLIFLFYRTCKSIYRQKSKQPDTLYHTAADHHCRFSGKRCKIHIHAAHPGFLRKTMIKKQKRNRNSLHCQRIIFCKSAFYIHP